MATLYLTKFSGLYLKLDIKRYILNVNYPYFTDSDNKHLQKRLLLIYACVDQYLCDF